MTMTNIDVVSPLSNSKARGDLEHHHGGWHILKGYDSGVQGTATTIRQNEDYLY